MQQIQSFSELFPSEDERVKGVILTKFVLKIFVTELHVCSGIGMFLLEFVLIRRHGNVDCIELVLVFSGKFKEVAMTACWPWSVE